MCCAYALPVIPYSLVLGRSCMKAAPIIRICIKLSRWEFCEYGTVVIIISKFTLTQQWSSYLFYFVITLTNWTRMSTMRVQTVFTFFPENLKICSPEAIVFSSENFWSYVVRCSTECWCCVSRPYSLFTHSIIRQLYVTFMIQENIIQFQVPINDSCQIFGI